MKKATVFIICPTCEYINRGFETHSYELFSMLKNEYKGQVYLLKGNGKSKNDEIKIFNFKNKSILNKFCCKVFNYDERQIQNKSFFLISLVQFIIKKPKIIYFGDPMLYYMYNKLRKLFKLKYKILFFTGGQSIPVKFNTKDLLIAGNDYFYKIAKSKNIKNSIKLPEGFSINKDPKFLNTKEKNYLKKQLNIPLNIPVVISVGVLNKSIKRMNYIINEIAKLKQDVFLILLGQKDIETSEIIKLAQNKLKSTLFLIKTVPKNKVNNYYKIADIFVLASTKEGFGRVYVEALENGLDIIAHDYEIAKNVLSNHAHYKDLMVENNLLKSITNLLNKPISNNNKIVQHKYAYQNFSWDKLKNDYLKLFY